MNRRRFIYLSCASVAALGGAFAVGAFTLPFSSSPAISISLEQFYKDLEGWDVSQLSSGLARDLAAGNISEKDRSRLYQQIFSPNKPFFIPGWGEKEFGQPGMFSI